MTKRGHRLVYSNGVIVLAGAAMVLVIATGGVVTKLIPLYAIGVFTGFTISQAGMVKHHLTHRHPGWRKSIVIQGIGCFLSFVVLLMVSITKFPDGAWVILVVLPLLVVLLLRLNRSTRRGGGARARGRRPRSPHRSCAATWCSCSSTGSTRPPPAPSSTPARLTPDELRVVHFVDRRRRRR